MLSAGNKSNLFREKERAKWLTTNEIKTQGISADTDDKIVEISVSDFVISLQGIFQPLSNYYAMNFDIKGDTYRSVEHYAYQRLFESLRLSYIDVMKIRTTVKPVDVSKAAHRLFKLLKANSIYVLFYWIIEILYNRLIIFVEFLKVEFRIYLNLIFLDYLYILSEIILFCS